MGRTPYDFKNIGKRIQQVRNARRYTQAELSEMIDINPKNMSRMECGTLGISMSKLIEICKVLDVSADYILFGHENENTESFIGTLLSELNEDQRLCAEKLLTVYVESCLGDNKNGER